MTRLVEALRQKASRRARDAWSYNGMKLVRRFLLPRMPKNWVVYQEIITFADATTFVMYLNANMRSFMVGGLSVGGC